MRIDPNCKACGGTGANSNNRICHPCQRNGRLVNGDIAASCIAGSSSLGTDRANTHVPDRPEMFDDPALDGF